MRFKYIFTLVVICLQLNFFGVNAQGTGFSVTPETANISENGGTINIYVVLDSAPSSDVVMDVVSSNVDNVIVSTNTLTFTPTDWNISQAIVATGINDDVNRDGDTSTVLISVNALLSDPLYGALADRSVVITCLDDETSIKNFIDFNDTDQLTDLFNPDSSPVFTNIADQGINNTGSINVPLGTSDIWTYKKGFSVSSEESAVYTFSAFFKILGQNGRGGLGFTNNPVNEPDITFGAPLTGLGMTFHGGGGEFVNNRATTYVDWPPGLVVGWYKMIFKITSNAGSDNFDVEFWIYNASADGTIGSLYSNQTGSFTNSTMASSDVIYVYFSAAGTRMEKIDDYEFEIEGATSIVEEGHPVVLGYEVTDKTTNSITAGGNVTSDGGTLVNEKGIVYATGPNPTTGSNKIALGDGLGLFSTAINDLEPNTTYFVRAYAINGTGTSYGAEKIVTTLGTPSIKTSKTSIEVDENGGSDTFLVSLGGQPASNVAINIVSNNTSEVTVSPSLLSFGPGTWDIPQLVTVTAVDDNDLTDDSTELTLSVDAVSSDDAYDGVLDSKVEVVLVNDDFDTDNDGVNDAVDQCAATPTGHTVDVNGCSDSQKDSDGDGVNDAVDQCPNTPSGETVDADGCSESQKDADGDGVRNALDQCADTVTGESVDANGCSDTQKDSDGDGTNDAEDAFPNDANEDTDSDGDGTGDNADAFPNDANEDTDSDGDGTGDNADAFPNDPNEDTDSDGDGAGDNADAFPNDPNEDTDSDGDGTGDNADAFPNDPNEDTDSDGDGAGDNADAFPNDANEDTDSDGDGTGDNTDAFPNDPTLSADSDGDGIPDGEDAFPNDPDEHLDTDGDGVGDNSDPDMDGDGIPNGEDEFPLEAGTDMDGDGVDDAADQCPGTPAGETVDAVGCSDTQTDTDGDGTNDANDAFPNDANEDTDSDGDGTGDNADAFPNDPTVSADSDGDGIPDGIDNCPLAHNPGQEDRDGDGLGDVCDTVVLDVARAFTPDGDGINDTWTIHNIGNYPNSLVRVFNSWGKEVFSARNYQNDWDGRYKDLSNKLPDAGSYYFQIDLEGDGKVDSDGWLYIKSK